LGKSITFLGFFAMLILSADGLKIHKEPNLIINVSPPVAEWGRGYFWIKYLEIYNCIFSQEANEKIKQRISVNQDRFILATKEQILNGSISAGDVALAIIEGFSNLLPAEQLDAVQTLNPDSYYGNWRNYAKDELNMGISVAGIARIIVDGHYLLMRPDHLKNFIPFGGVYTYRSPDVRSELEDMGAFNFIEDQPKELLPKDDFTRDMRFVLPTDRMKDFESWLFIELSQNIDSKIERHPIRELREELVTECNIFSNIEFDRLLYHRDTEIVCDTPIEHPSQYINILLTDESSQRRLEAIKRLKNNIDIDMQRIEKIEILSKLGWALEDENKAIKNIAIRSIIDQMEYCPAIIKGLGSPILNAIQKNQDVINQAKPILDQIDILRGDLGTFKHWLKSYDPSLKDQTVVSLYRTLSATDWIVKDYTEDPLLGTTLESYICMVVKRVEDAKDWVFPSPPHCRPDYIGRDSWRPYYNGMLTVFPFQSEAINTEATIWHHHFIEPYDFAVIRDFLAVSTGNAIKLINVQTKETKVIENQWFAQIHSIDKSPSSDKLLITSSGFDALIEISIDDGTISWEWFSCEQEFGMTISECRMSRSESIANDARSNGFRCFFIGPDPGSLRFGIPTIYRNHLNDGRYVDENNITFTLAHLGHAAILNRTTGEIEITITGLRAPHGFIPFDDGYIACDTQRGRLILLNKSFDVEKEIYLTGMGGLTDRKRDGAEWLQGAAHIENGLFLLIDGARDCLWIIDIHKKKYRRIKFSNTWRVHRAVPIQSHSFNEQLS
jgi:hypothetical protein